MKRHRPILYEVFGSPGSAERRVPLPALGKKSATKAATGRPARSRPAASLSASDSGRGARRVEAAVPDGRTLQELRVSYELLAVLALVLVVLAATLYYFAYVRGKSSHDFGSLSALEQGQTETDPGARPGPALDVSDSYLTVAVAKFPTSKQNAAFDACNFLEAKGHRDVHVIQVRGELKVCVGRAADKKHLEGTLAEIRGLLFQGRKDFAGASITTVSLKAGSR
jgi:hypothetical protein